MDNTLNYEPRSDGVLYALSDAVHVLVSGRSNRLKVEIWQGETLLPPDKGDIATAHFRSRLLKRTRATLGEVPNLERELGLIASKVEEHLAEAEPPSPPTGAGTSLADRLIGYATEEVQIYFTDQHGVPHALIEGEPVPPEGRRFRRHLRRLLWEREGCTCRPQALSTAIDTLSARAEFSGDVRELHTRAAWIEETLYYELRPGRVVKIDENGWDFDPAPPVLFRRVANLKPLPDPERGGSLDVLVRLANLKSGRDRRLYIVYFVTVVLPHIGRPIISASGAMGSGKTTIGRVVKRAWDPTAPETIRYDLRDFLQKCSHAFLLMMDNVGSLPDSAADTLCRLVTGEGDSKRKLFTDEEDVVVEFRRAVILNGINLPTDRADVLDRSLVVELERIPDSERKSEEEIWHEFEREHPKLLGAAFDALSRTMELKPSIELTRRPRLADWGEYAAAIYAAMGWEEDGLKGAELFLVDWQGNVAAQNRAAIEGSPVAQAIIRFMRYREEHAAPSSELYRDLEEIAERLEVSRDRAWPRSSVWLWRRIKEVLPALAAVGVEAEIRETSAGSVITFRKV